MLFYFSSQLLKVFKFTGTLATSNKPTEPPPTTYFCRRKFPLFDKKSIQ